MPSDKLILLVLQHSGSMYWQTALSKSSNTVQLLGEVLACILCGLFHHVLSHFCEPTGVRTPLTVQRILMDGAQYCDHVVDGTSEFCY